MYAVHRTSGQKLPRSPRNFELPCFQPYMRSLMLAVMTALNGGACILMHPSASTTPQSASIWNTGTVYNDILNNYNLLAWQLKFEKSWELRCSILTTHHVWFRSWWSTQQMRSLPDPRRQTERSKSRFKEILALKLAIAKAKEKLDKACIEMLQGKLSKSKDSKKRRGTVAGTNTITLLESQRFS